MVLVLHALFNQVELNGVVGTFNIKHITSKAYNNFVLVFLTE